MTQPPPNSLHCPRCGSDDTQKMTAIYGGGADYTLGGSISILLTIASIAVAVTSIGKTPVAVAGGILCALLFPLYLVKCYRIKRHVVEAANAYHTETSLYHCAHCDSVFNPITREHAPASQMSHLL